MKVAVITVCYNSVETIGKTLKSVAMQTHGNIEHIIIDGESHDGTQEIIRQHAHPGQVFLSEPDQGIYDAMNKGIQLATGDIIGILNADDIYANDDVLKRVLKIMEDEELDALYGDVEFFHPSNPEKTIRRYSSARFSPKRLAWGWMPAHPALFLRSEVFSFFGMYRPDFKIAGDYEFIARIFKNNSLKYRYLPEVLVRMRTGGVSTSGWKSTLLLNREVLHACRENEIDTNILMLLSRYPFKLLEFVQK